MRDQSLHHLSEKLEKACEKVKNYRVVAGFDGFVDEIISVVEERRDTDHWRRVEDLTAFRDLIGRSIGHSSLREVVVQKSDPGGCAINLGDGLASLGVKVECYATMGAPCHPAFDPIIKKFHSHHSWGNEYGRTLAFEFADGKLMFSAVSQLAKFNEALLKEVLSDGEYFVDCKQAGVIALTNWSLYPHMTQCWDILLRDVYSKLTHRPYFFFDLVDPSGRTPDDIKKMLHSLGEFEGCGKVVLGLNGNEANILSAILKLPEYTPDENGVGEQAQRLRRELNISQVVIHHRSFAVVADAQVHEKVKGPYCTQPQKSTGAGDRFNAGFCLGLMLSLEMKDCLKLASATSGYFVRTGQSADLVELIQFIKKWGDDNL